MTTDPSLTRRGILLGTGAAAGLSGASGLLVPGTAVAAAAPRRPPGLPPRGHLYYGGIVPHTTSVGAWEAQLGHRLGSRRTYFQPDNVSGLLRRAAEDLAAGRFPVLSIKPPGTWRSVARGRHDAWLARILDGLGALDAPLCFTVHHEPESDSGRAGNRARWHREMTELVYREAKRRAPRVHVIQILMAWTFSRRSKRHPERWLAPSVELFGMDAYNWWSPVRGGRWRELSELVDRARPYAAGRPIVVAEYGTRSDPERPGRAAQWMRDAYSYAVKHNVVALNYFNYAPRGIAEPFTLDAERAPVFADCLADPRSVPYSFTTRG